MSPHTEFRHAGRLDEMSAESNRQATLKGHLLAHRVTVSARAVRNSRTSSTHREERGAHCTYWLERKVAQERQELRVGGGGRGVCEQSRSNKDKGPSPNTSWTLYPAVALQNAIGVAL